MGYPQGPHCVLRCSVALQEIKNGMARAENIAVETFYLGNDILLKDSISAVLSPPTLVKSSTKAR